MKKFILAALLLALMVLPALSLAAGDIVFPTGSNASLGNLTASHFTSTQKSISQMANQIVNVVLSVVIIVAIIAIILAGYKFITAGGEPDKVNEARMTIMYAAIGVIVAVLAKTLISWAMGFVQ